jgi:group I intron endonuclease
MDKGNIYKITNKINNKIYIGCTIYSLEKRFSEHAYRALKTDNKSKLYNSIRKYGVKSFSIELIQECDLNIIYEIEKKYITELDTYDNGLNSTFGGEGCLGYVHSPEIRKKISEGTKNGNSHKGKTYDELYGDNADEERMKRKLSVENSWKNISDDKKIKRINNSKNGVRKNSKYGIDLIKEIKELIKIYPQMNYSYLYSIRDGSRWGDL